MNKFNVGFSRKKNTFAKRDVLLITAVAVILICLFILVSMIFSKSGTRIKAFSSIFASSDKSKYYKPQKAFDDKLKTAWTPKKQDKERFPWIKVLFKKTVTLKKIKLINGFNYKHKYYGDLYEKNNRVRSVRIVLSDYSSYYWMLRDNERDFQVLELPDPKKTRSVKIIIHSIYKGTTWDDLSISEIRFYGIQ
ncbi:MAG: discoidin domain-containing protein [Spirochaetes bacterium]|nr:discoidin domain-containing protein [Spirochaetota bacterium]